MVDVGICGQMASGKTTLAEALCNEISSYSKFSFAKSVKDFANFLFDIPEGYKDREKYQKVGDGGRRFIGGNVWIDATLNAVYNKPESDWGIIDDVRYINEVQHLKKEGWFMVKINISEELQEKRIKETYPDDWEKHLAARTHASEVEVAEASESLFDLVIDADDGAIPIETLIQAINDKRKQGHQQSGLSQHFGY
jgi:hypothetical protein